MQILESEEPNAIVLREVRRMLACRSPLRPLSDQCFDRSHEYFERSSDQQSRILEWLKAKVRSVGARLDPLRVLSVGCGSGILDNPLIDSLAHPNRRLLYTGLDPNPVACQRFQDDFATRRSPQAHLTLQQQKVEALRAARPFHLIHAVHSLYYLADVGSTIDRLVGMLAEGGRLIVAHAPKAELNRLADCFWARQAGKEIWYSDRLTAYLVARGHRFQRERITGWVDLADCFDAKCVGGRQLLDFIAQTDTSSLSGNIRQLCLAYLRGIARQEGRRMLVRHPVDLFDIG
jgi:histamine N-methyltransferase